MSDRPIISFIREHKLFRKIALVGGIVAVVYYVGLKQGWWQLSIGG
ncbi:uncharacterized protein METZ01_LOCUS340562 [marine metagenome]|uniref:Uncharacterized protein n=1 Tax=marine metagenome TaxID=408172 RepID=A0A382QS36_9ZZZZ